MDVTGVKAAPLSEGDILYCTHETGVDGLVRHFLYMVKGAERINGELILAVEDYNGVLHHSSASHFQGFCKADDWKLLGKSMGEVMDAEGFDEFTNELHNLAKWFCPCPPSMVELDGKVSMADMGDLEEDDDDEDDEDDEEAPAVTRESILAAAKKCVCGEREQDYGSPENNFGTIAEMWGAYLNLDISATDVAAMMALVKIARIASGHSKTDNWVDLAGYAACGGEIEAKL